MLGLIVGFHGRFFLFFSLPKGHCSHSANIVRGSFFTETYIGHPIFTLSGMTFQGLKLVSALGLWFYFPLSALYVSRFAYSP
jgi:hypothetical protein